MATLENFNCPFTVRALGVSPNYLKVFIIFGGANQFNVIYLSKFACDKKQEFLKLLCYPQPFQNKERSLLAPVTGTDNIGGTRKE